MSRRLWGVVLLFVACELLGIAASEAFYRLFLSSIPPMAVSELGRGTAHAVFLVYGFVLGVVSALGCLVAIVLSRFFFLETPPPRRAVV